MTVVHQVHHRRLTSQHFGFAATATTTIIPNYDVCRICFYLKCCLLGCEMIFVKNKNNNGEQTQTQTPSMIIVDPRIIDYTNAYKLSSVDQLYILYLALGEFNIERLINRKIFIDSEQQTQLLPPSTANSFFEVLQEEEVEEEVEQQQTTRTTTTRRIVVVNKVMVCTAQWIQDYYEKPVSGLLESFRNIPTLLPSSIRNLILQNEATMFNHCIHCRGMPGHCTCEEGCCCLPAGPNNSSCCAPIHRGFVCQECTTTTTTTTRRSEYITGPRYRCLNCSSSSSSSNPTGIVGGGGDNDCNLCHTCYTSVCCEHDQTHEFELVNRPGQQPRRLLPKGFVFNKGGNSTSSSTYKELEGNETFQEFLDGIPAASAIVIETATVVIDNEEESEH